MRVARIQAAHRKAPGTFLPADLINTLLLKCWPRLSRLRQVPGLGGPAHRVSHWLLPPDRLVWVKVRKGPAQGLWLRLRPRTGGDYCQGSAEPALQEVMCSYLQPGMVFYDLGANLGFFSLLAAKMVGAKGLVVSFEPDPQMVHRLKENVRKNGFQNVRVHECAAWSTTGLVAFRPADESESPDHGFGKVERSLDGNPALVSSVALDDFTGNEAAPDFVKCDVEGGEFDVFTGARKTLAAHRPIVVCEVHSQQNSELLTGLFADLGYSLDWITTHHFLARPKKSP